jgi:hypothetical protein
VPPPAARYGSAAHGPPPTGPALPGLPGGPRPSTPLPELRPSAGTTAAREIGKLIKVLLLFGVVGAVVVGLLFFNANYSRAKSLATGDCIKSIPMWSNVSVEKVECSSKSATYKVVSNKEASGSSYPGNLSSLEASCEKGGGTSVRPDRNSWEDGDHFLLCLKRNRP